MPLTKVPPVVLDAWLAGRIGYGRLAAPYWFIGLEERCTDPHGEIRLRLHGELLEDFADAHERIRAFVPHLIHPPVTLQPTWRPLLRFLLAAKGERHDDDSLRAYQSRRLGRAGDETLAGELMPLPCPGLGAWPFAVGPHVGHPELVSRVAYEAALIGPRITFWRDLIAAHAPALVLAYGDTRRDQFREVFNNGRAGPWQPLDIDGSVGWAEYAWLPRGEARSLAIITPHPQARGVHGSDWIELGASIARLLAGGDATAEPRGAPARAPPSTHARHSGITREQLIGVLREVGPFEMEEYKDWTKVKSTTTNRKLYFKRGPTIREAHLSGYCLQHEAIESLTAAEASRAHIGRVRGRILFDRHPQPLGIKAFRLAAEALLDPTLPVDVP